jgi:hypothetical protein
VPQSLVVTIPGEGKPTGLVFYGGPGFVVSKGQASGPSRGMTLAPPSFGKFSNRLLAGNFGGGMINAED